MCGIAGVTYAGAPRDLSGVVHRMVALQQHRGPDGQGFYSSANVALGHCRLAILDLSAAGHQPMADPQKRFWITFNGEIYNYLELAQELRCAGHQMRSRCDTEVLLAAYCKWGSDCLRRLRGMFAFAIWDEQDKRLFAARDRLGIKPFHYYASPGHQQLAFASEIKALLDFLPERRINEPLARQFLAWNLLDHHPTETMVQDVQRLPPGHFLTWDARTGLTVQPYWSFEVSDQLDSDPNGRARLVEEFREQFMQSVALHLRSDVPVGSCLSGGLDSSSIVCAVTAQLRAQGAWREDWQHTFSAVFDDPRIDERRYIKVVTDATLSRPHHVFPSGERLAGEIDTWLWHQEEPVGGTGVYARYCVARLAREHGIKVLLDGQGADEQLAGYRKFILVYLRQLLKSGAYVRAAREAAAFFSSWELLKTSQLAAGKRYWASSSPETSALWVGQPTPERPLTLSLNQSLGQRLHADLTTFSLPVLLRFEDRNTMAFGVESRVPFVDHVLVEWLAKLPADLRLSNGWTKRILREGLSDVLPPRIRMRKSKLGFSTPETAWLRGPLNEWLNQTLARPMHLGGLVATRGITQLLDAHAQNASSAADEATLFRLAVFEHWARLFLPVDVAARVRKIAWA